MDEASYQVSCQGDQLCQPDARLPEGHIELDLALREAKVCGPGELHFATREGGGLRLDLLADDSFGPPAGTNNST